MRDALKSPPSFSAGSTLASAWENGKGRFLIDGFPRKMDQAIKFDESVGPGTELGKSHKLIPCSDRPVLLRAVLRYHRRGHALSTARAGQDVRTK
jgi:adenylate kinase family enzyme